MNFSHLKSTLVTTSLAYCLFLTACGRPQEQNASLSAAPFTIEIPSSYFPIQTTNWSCGPNSVSRMLNVLGVPVKYEEVRDYAEPMVPSIDLPAFGIPKMLLGSPPELVLQLIHHWSANTPLSILRDQKSSDAIVQALAKGNPVLTLIRSGTDKTLLGDTPVLHWVMITGYDFLHERFELSDPGYNKIYWEARSSFEGRWLWSLPTNVILKSVYQSIGYTPGIMVKID